MTWKDVRRAAHEYGYVRRSAALYPSNAEWATALDQANAGYEYAIRTMWKKIEREASAAHVAFRAGGDAASRDMRQAGLMGSVL